MLPTLDLITQINAVVNIRTTYKADTELYNKIDFWTIIKNPQLLGDCEDYALTKRFLLLKNNVEVDSLHLATCWTETNDYHAILIVTTDEGDYVLDNRYPQPMMKQELDYKWHKIQEGDQWYELS